MWLCYLCFSSCTNPEWFSDTLIGILFIIWICCMKLFHISPYMILPFVKCWFILTGHEWDTCWGWQPWTSDSNKGEKLRWWSSFPCCSRLCKSFRVLFTVYDEICSNFYIVCLLFLSNSTNIVSKILELHQMEDGCNWPHFLRCNVLHIFPPLYTDTFP